MKWKEMRKSNKRVEEREWKNETETREEISRVDYERKRQITKKKKNRRKEEWKNK